MINISIIAKDQILYKGEASSVVVPTKMGIIEVLPNHMQLVSALSTGDIILKIGDEERKKIPIQGGVLEVRAKSNIIILVN